MMFSRTLASRSGCCVRTWGFSSARRLRYDFGQSVTMSRPVGPYRRR